MSCARCDDLARRLAEAEEELAAWRGDASDDAAQASQALRLARWRRLIPDVSPGRVFMLLALVDARGKPLRAGALQRAMQASPFRRQAGADSDEVRTAMVNVSSLRAGLRRAARAGRIDAAHAAFDAGIETITGLGYCLPGPLADGLKAAAGEA